MKIGFTERGDAGIDLSWRDKLSSCDGAVLITKRITNEFIDEVIKLCKINFPFVIHATVTGWGGTLFEPCAPHYKKQLDNLKTLVKSCPCDIKNRYVIRIDPIFPTVMGTKRVRDVLAYAKHIGLLPCRVRISIYDEYKHVKERLKAIGKNPLYGDNFYASYDKMKYVAKILHELSDIYNVTFETCAEPTLVKALNEIEPQSHACVQAGCLSETDLKAMGLPLDEVNNASVNNQNRHGCMCLSFKKELLTQRKQCPNKCIYCYWKEPNA